MVMFPLMITIVVIAWFILKTMYPFKAKEIKLEIKGGARNNWRTNLIYVTFAVTIALWMLEKVVGMNSYVVALIPVGVFCATGIFSTDDLKEIEWSVLWMVAGGFALGVGMDKTALQRLL